MRAITIYIEGGGETKDERAVLRQGFDQLLREAKSKGRNRRLKWRLVCCGGRNETFHAFMDALQDNPGDLHILLVDSEGPVPELSSSQTMDAKGHMAYLEKRDNWRFLSVDPRCVHLMAQCMEAWLVADADALVAFYGQYFKRTRLPSRWNLEEEAKSDILDKLTSATKDHRIPKGTYAKITHASQLLRLIDPQKVSERCPRFQFLVNWLEETM